MADGTDRATHIRSEADGGTVETLASRALGARGSKRASAASLLSERFLDELDAAVRSAASGRRAAVVADMLDAGIRREDIVDFYIPEVARRMGAEWCEDGLGFADVTIGVARLQGLLREIAAEWFDGASLEPDMPGLMVIVMADESHTLGAMVLRAQLARLDVSVKLLVGRSETEVLRSIAGGDFDAILISAAVGEQIATLKGLVEKIRASTERPTPIVIGGSIVTREDDIKTRTSADHATTDPAEALKACGLRVPHAGARRRATAE